MNLNSRFAGTPLKEYRIKIPWRATTNYAACVADGNPLYFEDIKGGKPLAPPTFPVAVTWPILRRLQEFILADDFPGKVLLTQVHYTEHLVLHRLVRPGDELVIKGRVAAIIPHRAGTHAIVALFASDRKGCPVFTEYTGAMLRGVGCDREKGKEELPHVPLSKSSSTLWSNVIPIDPLLPYLYDGCSNMEFPIHTSQKFAKAVGLPGIILQGTATLALAIRDIVNQEACGNPELISQVSCKFTGMVKPGTHIEIRCLECRDHPGHRDVFFDIVNADNIKVVRSGYVKLNRPME